MHEQQPTLPGSLFRDQLLAIRYYLERWTDRSGARLTGSD